MSTKVGRKQKTVSKNDWEKVDRQQYQGLNFYLPKYDPRTTNALERPPKLDSCNGICTDIIELFPSMQVEGYVGYGYHMINVDGYRYLNCYMISDAVFGANDRGFTLEISFALEPPSYGETSDYFNVEEYYDTTDVHHRLIRIQTSDLLSTGNLPWLSGINLVHQLRTPVMGPYVRASVLNRDDQTHSARVVAYATT